MKRLSYLDHFESNETVSQKLYEEYKCLSKQRTSQGRRKAVLPKLAEDNGFYPWMMFRMVATEFLKERDGKPPSKREIQTFLRSPHTIKDVQLQFEAIHCAMQDDLQGLITDQIRNLVGRDHELVLANLLTQNGVAFIDEETQRKQGQDVTPDFRLLVPINVKNRPVCWIDSKALFGDAANHQSYLNNQLLSYFNRFGPGLVIYWFGHEEGIEQLAPEVQVATKMPDFVHFEP